MFPAIGENAKLGKGMLFLDIDDANGVPVGLQRMGSCDSVELSSEIDKAELFSATQASAPKMASTVRRSDYTLVATCREFTLTNLKLFLLGTDNVKAQTAQVNQTLAIPNVAPGKFYEIGGFRKLTAVSIVRGTETLTPDEDYVLNTEFGMFEVVGGGPNNVVAGDDLVVTYSKPVLTIDQIRVNTAGSSIARLVYIADDANADGVGKHDRLELWRVDVAPDGALNLISEDFGSFQLRMDVLGDSVAHPSEPFGTLDRVRAA